MFRFGSKTVTNKLKKEIAVSEKSLETAGDKTRIWSNHSVQ